ncbi:hypothetical protein IAU60_001313 [Kwoniella sp. DSM 27419]
MSAPPPEEYLAAGFDPTSLRVPQLRSILLAHGHGFSSSAKKADLVQAFEQQVLVNAPKIRPSAKGIVAVSENGDEAPVVPAKRARGRPRKTEDAPTPEDEQSPAEEIIIVDMAEENALHPSKKAKSRSRKSVSIEPEAQKSRAKTRKSAGQFEDVDEGVEAEIEDEAAAVPQTKRGRASLAPATPASAASTTNRRKSNIGSSSRATSELRTPSVGPTDVKPPRSARKSEPAPKTMENVAEESEKEDSPKKSKLKTPRRSIEDQSGFSDFNPFQSGSEEAAERARRRRKSSMGPGTAQKPSQPRFSEPGPSISTPGLRRMGPSRENLRTPPSEVKAAMKRELDAAIQYNQAVEEKFTQMGARESTEPMEVTVSSHLQPVPNNSLVRRVEDKIATVPAARATIPLSALFLLLLSLLANFKSQSASVGYCDSAATTNNRLLTRQSAVDNAQACIARKASLELDNPAAAKAIQCDVSALPLLPFVPRASSCTPCPPHAECAEGDIVTCIPEYLLTSHPLSFLSPFADGLPGVGPRAFPPSCRPDTVKKRMVGGLAKELERDLAKGRGSIVCAGIGKDDGRKGEGERFGVDEAALKERFAMRRDPKFSREQFDEIFESALKDLVEHEDVIESIDVK